MGKIKSYWCIFRLFKAEQEHLAATVEKKQLEQKFRGEIETAKVRI